MTGIRKRIVTDDQMNPIAVQIDYTDWLEIERRLEIAETAKPSTDLSRHAGRLKWPMDGMEFQEQARREWD